MTLLNWFFVVLGASYLVEVIIRSALPVHLTNLVLRTNLYTREDLRTWLLEKAPSWLFDLLHCEKCLAFHCSWLLLLLTVDQNTTGSDFVLRTAASAFVVWLLTKTQVQAEPKVRQAKVIRPEPKTAEFLGSKFRPKTEENGVVTWELAETDSNKEELLKFFDSHEYCTDPYCFGLKAAYEEEVAKLHIRAEADSRVCSSCELNGLKNKYYKKIKAHVNGASLDSKVPGPRNENGK